MTKMKGLLKGLRYISQIFDNGEDKGKELQIGFPTDVKHVAHIGWDGPSAAAPSWMSEFKSAPELSTAAPLSSRETKRSHRSKVPSEESKRINGQPQGSPARDLLELPKPSRHHQSSSASSLENATQEATNANAVPKHSRRHNSVSMNSPTREVPSYEGTKPSRRSHNSSSSVDSPSREAPPKQSRKKKTKGASSSGEGSRRGGSGGGSVRSRPKSHTSSSSAAYVATFSDPGSVKDEPCPLSPLKELQFEGKGGGIGFS